MKSSSLAFFSFLLLPACTLMQKPSATDYLQKLGGKINESFPQDFRQIESLPTDSNSLSSFQASNGQILRLQSFPAPDLNEAKKIFQYRSRIVRALFETQVVAYRGKVTVEETCLSKNQVQREAQETPSGLALMYNLMGTKNYVYGSCAEAEDEFKSQYILLYCANAKTVIEAKLFYNKTEADLKSHVVECL